MKENPKAPKGTRDIWAPEVFYWQKFEAAARQILNRAAYREIRTPSFEFTELFARGIGEATDIVGKEMYTFVDKKKRSLTLRPEGTAGVVRAFIENRLYAQGSLQRLWYIGPMFRYENPQAGRQRQFHQLGVEVLGSDDPRADVEVIAIASDLLRELGLSNLVVDLNSVGNSDDRQHYRDALVAYFTPHIDELDRDSRDRLDRNPLRILDSKVPRTQEICLDAPSILDYLGDASQQHFEQVQTLLGDLGIAYQINPRLVRGLDYYTHTAFEIQSTDLGAQSAICGGGRYDRLVAELGGPNTPAVGWALGIERLIILLQQHMPTAPTQALDFYLVSRGSQAEPESIKIAQKLRQAGFSVEVDLSGAKFDKQMKRANHSGAIAALILGDQEVNNHTINLKWLASGHQEATDLATLLAAPDQLRQQLSTN
jgi:histidyl-tRNA synthetase